jgi:hypothetical protein
VVEAPLSACFFDFLTSFERLSSASSLVRQSPRAPLGYDVPTFNGIQSLKGSMVYDFTMRPFSCLVVEAPPSAPNVTSFCANLFNLIC